ncbi:hypothetical protein [Pseudomonas putida]|uniref:hypothetical protein n=1 Tax=Pseudomonas putida TaxID=303 RepID=UPI003AF409FF
MIAYFQARPAYAAALLAEVRRGGDPAECAVLLRQLQRVVGRDSTVKVGTTGDERE